MSITDEIVVYVNQPYKKYRWLGYMSIMQIGFVVVNFLLMPTPKLIEQRAEALRNRVRKKEPTVDAEQIFDDYEPNPDYDPSTVLQRMKRMSYRELFAPSNILDNISSRPIFSGSALGAVLLISSAFFIYCRRVAHVITLLPNNRVRFTSFSPLAIGKPPSVEVALKDVSCVSGRKSEVNYSILKFKGYYGYHLVRIREGQFLEPELYDKYLGYSRPWATTNT